MVPVQHLTVEDMRLHETLIHKFPCPANGCPETIVWGCDTVTHWWQHGSDSEHRREWTHGVDEVGEYTFLPGIVAWLNEVHEYQSIPTS